MTKDDLQVWAPAISRKVEPSMENLLEWMEEEMTARIRSGATIRKNILPQPGVHAAGTKDGKSDEVRLKKCYVCKGHYVDECQRFIQMSPGERL